MRQSQARSRRVFTLAVACTVALGLIASPVSAATSYVASAGTTVPKDPAKRQQQVQKELAELRKRIAQQQSAEQTARGASANAAQQRVSVEAQLAALDDEIAAVEQQLVDANTRLNDAQREFVIAETTLEVAEAGVGEARRRLKESSIDAYMGIPTGNEFKATDQQSGDELAIRFAYVDVANEIRERVLTDYRTKKDDATAAFDDTTSKRDFIADEQWAIAVAKDSLDIKRAAQDELRAQLAAEEKRQAGAAEKARQQQASLITQIAELQAESDQIAALLRSKSKGTPVAGNGVLASPIPGATITSSYGNRVHPIYGTVKLHAGIDYRAASGTTIRSAGAGTVVSVGWRGGYGMTTLIDHGNGLATLYAHQSSTSVTVGQSVVRGQSIGKSGATGNVTGPHLHFEVRVNGTPTNPTAWL